MRAIAVSDVHLGWEESEVASFRAFLADLPPLDYFLVLGDFVEMWRRNAVRALLEHRGVFDQLQALSERCHVVMVAGNHDMHFHRMGSGYPPPFDWTLEYRLPVGDRTYVFKHGHQYDPSCQNEALDEALCHTNDKEGARLANLGNMTGLGRQDPTLVTRLAALPKIPLTNPKVLQRLAHPGLRRDAINLQVVRARARASIKPGEYLIHGHTHVPHLEANYADTGSWVEGESTYIDVQDHDVRLLSY